MFTLERLARTKWGYTDPGTAALILTGVGVASTVAAAEQGRKATKATNRARAEQARAAELQANRERRNVIRRGRINRQAVISAAVSRGAAGSSGELGTTAATRADIAGGVGLSKQISGFNRNISIFQGQAADFQQRASIFSGVSSLAFAGAGSRAVEKFDTPAQSTIFSPLPGSEGP